MIDGFIIDELCYIISSIAFIMTPSQKLTIADEGVYEPPILADVICEQPLTQCVKKYPIW